MRVTSLKTIYLTEEELKQVISNHLREKGDHILAEHLHTNICTMEWLKNGNFAISIDGEVNEKCLYTAVSSRIDKLNNDTKEMIQPMSTTISFSRICGALLILGFLIKP